MKRINKIINDFLYEKSISKSFVAREIGESPQNFSQKLRLTDLTVEMVMKISIALKKDFFLELSKEYDKEIGSKEPVPYVQDDKISVIQDQMNEMFDYMKQSNAALKKEINEIKTVKDKELKTLKKSQNVPRI